MGVLQSSIASNSSQISQLGENVSDNMENISSLTSEVENNKENISLLASSVTKNTESISTLSGSVKGNTTNIASLTASVSSNSSLISSLESDMAGNAQEIENVKEDVQSNSTTIQNVKAGVDANNLQIQALSNGNAMQEDQIEALQADVKELKNASSSGGGSCDNCVTMAMTTVSSTVPDAQGEYREYQLACVNGKKLVFYQEWSNYVSNIFAGGAFDEILIGWVIDASTSDVQSHRSTLTTYSTQGWGVKVATKHVFTCIGIKS